MAATLGAKILAFIRPCCGWLDVAFEFEHSVARKYSHGVLDKPFNHGSAHRWAQSVALRPVEFFQYAPAVSKERSLRSYVAEPRRIIVYIITTIGSQGSYVGRRILNIPGNQAYHDTLISHGIDSDTRRRIAYTANMLRAAVTVYSQLGIHLIYLTAGLSAGGRLWPKYGFIPVNSREWRGCRRRILRNLKKLPKDVQAQRGSEILSLVDHPDPLNLRIIYQMDDPVRDIVYPHRTRKLGPVLLTRTRWQGVLDLSDPTSGSIFSSAIAEDLAAAPPVRTS
ncbi:hypothetical protein [Bradyrhizobium uaiense]|uniref:Uncharacterized protein n=1 Tax=Bradyrhizobium uaiense TaxID=2594946 RepID=A0A6P1BS48_9BRAD|nr:hypothetical protein [Bradyrhizobium uaiense]NEV01065.1 hypothetical protein [Bradyrhizobium uaiense]